jgi:hypothetical protein
MNSHNLNKIEILKDFLERDKENPLELFSLFVTSNPDFKYNITYLTDQIGSFRKCSLELEKRFSQFKKVINQIREDTPKEISGYLIFDNVFQYGINTDEEDRLEFINLDLFRFDKFDNDYYILKFIFGDVKNPEKIEAYKIDQKKDTDIESKIRELWASFIK